MRQTLRQLQPGEAVPVEPPRRHPDAAGYIRVRWTIAPYEQVEVREHRVRDGVVLPADVHVHHINGNRADNRPENLEYLSASAHARLHQRITWDVERAYGDYQTGHSLPVLSSRYGVHHVTILRAFRGRGLRVRSASEAWVFRRCHFSGPSGAHRKTVKEHGL